MTVQFRADLDSGGQGLALQFPDGLTSISNSNDIQTITIGKASSFTLTVQVPGQSGPQTTAPIAVTTTPPGHYALLTAPLPSAGVATIGVAWQVFGDATPNALFEVFDGSLAGTRLAAVWLDQTQPAASSADADGQAYYLLPDCTFSGATAVVRLTGIWDLTGATYLHLGGIKVTPQGGAATYYPFDGTAAHYTLAPADGWPNRTGSGGIVNRYDHGLGAGDCYSIDVAECQAKLAALTGVGVGNVAVAEWVAAGEDLHAPPDSDPTTANHFAVRSLRTHQITFQGAVGHRAFALMTASDANIAVAHTQVGGQFPILTLDGVPITLNDDSLAAGGPFVLNQGGAYLYAAFPQYPAEQVTKGGSGSFVCDDLSGHWARVDGSGYPDPILGPWHYKALALGAGGDGVGATALWDGQRPGTYSLHGTWTADPGHTHVARHVIAKSLAAGGTVALGTVDIDQSVAPSGAVVNGTTWQLIAGGLTLTDPLNYLTVRTTNAGADGSVLVADALKLVHTSNEATIRANANSVATLSIPADYWITGAGPVPQASAFPVHNSFGAEVIPIPGPGDATTLNRVGYNITTPVFLNLFSNFARQIQWYAAASPDANAPWYAGAVDANGYPTRMGPVTARCAINGVPMDPGNGYKGLGGKYLPKGRWTILWDGDDIGASDLGLVTDAPGTCVEDASAAAFSTAAHASNRRTFVLDAGKAYSASLYLIVHGFASDPAGGYSARFRNLRIYPPEVDLANPTQFLPSALAWGRPLNLFRFLDALDANSGNWRTLDDINRPNRIDYNNRIDVVSQVASIAPYSGPAINVPLAVPMLVTTTAPHGLVIAQAISVAGHATITLSDGGQFVSGDLGYMLVGRVISPTQFVTSRGYGTPNVQITNTTSSGTVSCSVGTHGWNLDDCIDWCNANDGDFYFPICPSVTDQFCIDAADRIAARLKPGLKCYAAYSNETWNTGFNSYQNACAFSYAMDPANGDVAWWVWLVWRGGQVHWLMRDRFAAAGRGGDLVRVMGGLYAYPTGSTAYIIDQASKTPVIVGGTYTPGANPPFQGGTQVSAHTPLDAIEVGPYVGNNPFDNTPFDYTNQPKNDLLTVPQLLTIWSLVVKYGGFDRIATYHTQYFTVHNGVDYSGVQLFGYEGGLQNPLPRQTFASFPYRSQAFLRHPRQCGLFAAFCATLQRGGLRTFAYYMLQGGMPTDPNGSFWELVNVYGQPVGTGDPAENPDPFDLDSIKSQQLGGMAKFIGYLAGTVPITPLLNRIRLRWRDIFRPRLAAAVIPPPTITGITISPTTLTMAGGTSHQFTASVTGTGSYDPTVTWSRSPADGTMSSGGSFTAPTADHSADLTIDVIATAADGTHTATAVVTVPAEAVVIPPPATPAGLTVGATTASSIALSWSAGGGGGPVGTYELDVSPHNANSWSVAYTGSAPTATATGLAASTSYDFRVKASNTSGSSAWSATVSGSTAAASVPAATAYTFTGPTAGTVGTASGLFTVQPNGPYNGTITITPSGDGLTTPIVLSFSNSSAPQSFSITPTSAGTAPLTPTNSGGLTNPAAISFNATTVVTAGGTLATYTAAADAGTTFPSYASFPVVLAPGLAVTGLKVNNLATQTDVKTYWPDGSIKQAQVTALIPAAGPLAITEGPASAGTFPGVTAPAVTATLTKSDSTATTVTAPTTPTASLWLDGPLLKVYRSTVARGANGDTREFHVWLYADGSAHVEFLHGYELDGGNRRAAEEIYAEVKLTVGGTTVATTTTTQPPGFPLNNYCNYSLLADVGGRSHVVVHPDTESWAKSGLMPRYRTGGLGVIGWANHGFGPMQRGWVDVDTGQDLNSDMGEVGGHPHIGLVPAWDAGYLSQPTLALYRALLGNAATAGSWPVHVRSAATATMVRIDAQPNYFFAAGITGSDPRDTGSHNLPDVAHMANLAYTAYLLTGREYHLREVQNWANFALIANATGPRGGAAGLVWGTGQVRAYAWGFRQIAMAAVLSPDADPLHGYFRTAAINNTSSFDSYAGFHASTSQAPLATWLESEQQLPVFVNGQWDGHTYSFNPCTSQFQLAFLAQAIDYAISAGIPGGGDLLDGIINWYSCMYGSPDVCDLAYVGSIDYPTVGLNADPTTPTNSAWTLFQSWDDFARLALGRPPFTSSAAAGQPSLIGEFNASAFCAAMIGWRRNFAPLKHYGPTIEALLVSTAPVQIYASFAYARPLDTEILARPAIGPAFTVSPATVPAGTTTTVTLHGRPVVLGMTTWTRLTRINLGGPANQANLAPATADYVNQVLAVAVTVPAGASGTIPVTTTDDAPLASFNLTIG